MTLVFHIDESRDGAHHYHVGLLSDGPGQAAVESGLQAIVDQAFGDGACRWRAELHAVEIFHQTGQWSTSTIAQSIQVFDQALALLEQHGVEVIARGANLDRFRKKYGAASDPFVLEFSNLLERLNERLSARQDYGLVIADQQTEYRDTLQRNLISSRQVGTGGYRSQKLTRILDAAHFVDSKLSPMTQLADIVAFVMRRRASRTPEHDARLEKVMHRWFARIYGALPNPPGKYHSIR